MAKIARGPRASCPTLETVVVIDPRATRPTRSAGRAARARPRPRRRRAGRARAPRSSPRTRTRSSTRRARPGRRRAACSPTATTASSSRCARSESIVPRGRRRLPLPAARALVRAADPADRRSTSARTIAYFGGDPKQIVAELMEVKPHYLPSVPRIFEKIYTLVTSSGDPEKIRGATQLGLEGARAARRPASRSPPSCRRHFDKADEELFRTSATSFGGRLRQATSGAAPIATGDPRVLLRLRRAGARGLRHDRDRHGVDRLDRRQLQASAPSGGPLPRRRDPDRRGRRGPGQGPEHLQRLLQDGGQVVRRDRATAGCTPATSARSTRTASSRSPAARRTSSSPRAARTSRRRTSRTTSSSRAGSRRRSCTATAGPTPWR